MKAEIFTTIANLKANKHYVAAKSGDPVAAFHLVNELISQSNATNILEDLPDGTNISPVWAIERTGINEIPRALANRICSASQDKEIYPDSEIIMSNKVFHTGANAISRLINKPFFEGTVHKGEYYFLVDDVVTTGSSLNEMALYIKRNGGFVVGCCCLAASYSRIYGYSSYISMEESTINEILRKFDSIELNKLLKRYGYQDFKELTNGQGKFITSFKSLDTFRKRLVEAEGEAIARNIQNTFPEWED